MGLILRGAAIIVALLFAQVARAQDVTLTARDGGLALAGQLLGYDGEFYRIDTPYGLLTVDAEGAICDGPACPDLMAPLARVRIMGAADVGSRLLPGLLRAFVAGRGLVYAQQVDGMGFVAEVTDPLTNQLLAQIGFAPASVDLARAALVSGDAELMLAGAPEAGFGARALGLEVLIPIVARENSVSQVRSTALAEALLGQVTNWQALGGPDMPIVVHSLAADTALQAAVVSRLGGPVVAGVRHADAASLAAAVARDPWALALTGQSLQGASRALPLTDSCDFPLPATDLTVKAEDYPLTAPVYLVIPRRRLPLLVREFLEFLATPAAAKAVAAAGYIDRRPGRAPLTEDGQRLLGAIRNAGPEVSLAELQRLAAAMTGADRLSLTFRFQGGSAVLDAHSRDNLADLARLIGARNFDGESLTLTGFSDGTGNPDVNLALSKSRAEAVRHALRQIAPDLTEAQLPKVDAFGEALPMACDTTEAGRQVNRRVELWLRPLTDSPKPEN